MSGSTALSSPISPRAHAAFVLTILYLLPGAKIIGFTTLLTPIIPRDFAVASLIDLHLWVLFTLSGCVCFLRGELGAAL